MKVKMKLKKPSFENVRQKKIFVLLGKLLHEREAKHNWNNWVCLVMQFVFSYIVLFIIEAMARHSVTETIDFAINSTHVFFYNGLMIFLSSLVAFLFRKRRLFRFIIYTAWILLGIVNSVILNSRVTPLTGPDFKNVTEAMAIIGKYFTGVEIVLFVILIVFIVGFVLIYAFRSPRYKGKMHRIINIALIAACCFGFYQLTLYYIQENILSSYFVNITNAYEDYGFPYCFAVTVLDTGMSEPNNYSSEMIEKIVDQSQETVGDSEYDTDNLPNIIVVQLESFFDLTRVKGLTLSEDPLPNWHSLCLDYTSGFYEVPTFGAGTVNTEFETLTGMSMHFFGAGEYPYKSILKEEACESSAFILKDLGYTDFAVHDNEANFYSRKKVYKNLGFDYFISGEYMDTQDDVNENGWMRDENLIEPIKECLDSTEGQDYVFTVSVQPHGSYPTEQVIEDPEIEVTKSTFTDEENWAWEYYANQIYEEDQFVADLISMVEERGEPTIILFYGDHLPSMNVADNDLKEGSIYQTNYLLWDNLGLKQKDKTMASYQAIATIFNKLKIHDGSIFTFQQANLKSKDSNYNTELQALQYDLLYGEQYLYSYKQYIPNSDYKLGLYDPVITDVSAMNDKIHSIDGANFTQSSKVMINGEIVDTVFVDNTQLLVLNAEINPGDSIVIGMQSNSSTHKILSKSEAYEIPELETEAETVSESETVSGSETETVETNADDTQVSDTTAESANE